MATSLFIVVHIVTLFLLTFFAVLVVAADRTRPMNWLVSAFFLSLALSFSDAVAYGFRDVVLAHAPHAFYVGTSFDLLVGPLLWLCVVALLRGEARLNWRQTLHALPFAAHLAFMSARFHLHPADAKRAILDAGGPLSAHEVTLLTVLVHAQFCIYGALSARLVWRSRALDEPPERARPWPSIALAGFGLIWTLRAVNSVLWLQAPGWMHQAGVDVRPIVVLGVFAFACALFVQVTSTSTLARFGTARRYQNAALPDEDVRELGARLLRHMEEDRPYLDPDFDLKALAEGVSLPPHRVSQVLNVGLGQSFFEIVNGYRVRYAEHLLTSANGAGMNISEIMLEGGFNSKSVFNTAFKRATGMTPTQYRRAAAAVSLPSERVTQELA